MPETFKTPSSSERWEGTLATAGLVAAKEKLLQGGELFASLQGKLPNRLPVYGKDWHPTANNKATTLRVRVGRDILLCFVLELFFFPLFAEAPCPENTGE